MYSTSDLFDEDFQVPLKFFNKILTGATPTSPIIRITNRPLFLPKTQYPHTKPVIGVNSNNAHPQDILKINVNPDLREVSCIGNKVNASGESIIHECSKSSLNLSTRDDEPDGTSGTSNYKQAENKNLYQDEDSFEDFIDGELSDLNHLDSNEKLLSLISTTSSSSSTREYYLPAITGSTDTVRRTISPGTSRIKTPMNYSKNSNNIINPIDFKTVAKFLEGEKEMRPEKFVYITETDEGKKAFNEAGMHADLLNNNTLNAVTASGKFSHYDAHFEPVLNKKTNINQLNKTKEIQKKSLTTSKTMKEESNFPYPSPCEWIKEIHNSKLVIKQDIIEKDFSTLQESSKINFRDPNSQFFDSAVPRNFQKYRTQQRNQKLRQILSLGNSKDLKMSKLKTTSDLSDYEILNYYDKNTDNVENLQDQFARNEQKYSSKLNATKKKSQLEVVKIPETKYNDLLTEFSVRNYSAYLPEGKFKELPGLLDEIRDKPGIKNLVVTSQVLSESVEVEKNEQINNPLPEHAKLQEVNNDGNSNTIFPTELDEPINFENSKLERSRGDLSLNRSFYILNETIPTDFDAFKQVRDFFNLNKTKTLGSNEKYTVVGNHENSVEIFSKILNLDNQTSKETERENIVSHGKSSIPNSKLLKPEENLENLKFEIEEGLKFEIEEGLKFGIDSLLTSGRDDLFNEQQKDRKKLVIHKGRLISKKGFPAFVYDKTGFPLTDTKGRILKNNQEVPLANIENVTVHVYDAENIPNDHPEFDASKRPIITTLVKITDQAKIPASLYNSLGLPLTDEDGMLLHDSRGNILVTLDSNFFPLCCKTGMPIYLRNGTSWLSQRCKFTVTTQHKAKVAATMTIATERSNKSNENINNGQLDLINKPLNVQHEQDFKTKPMKQDEAVETDFENHTPEKEKKRSLISLTDILRDLGYSNSENKIKNSKSFDSLEKIQLGQLFQIYDIEGNCLTDAQGYTLRNEYGEPLVLFDKEGNPISDWCGGGLFDSNGEPLCNSSKRAPERPYSDGSFEENTRLIYFQGIPKESLENYRQNEPLLNIIKRNDLRALNINNDVVPSVQFVESFSERSNYSPAANNYSKNYSEEQIEMYNNDLYDNYFEEEDQENYKDSSEILHTPNDLAMLSADSIENGDFLNDEQEHVFPNPYDMPEESRYAQKYETRDYNDSAYFYTKSVQYY